jgi:hypothetical protein
MMITNIIYKKEHQSSFMQQYQWLEMSSIRDDIKLFKVVLKIINIKLNYIGNSQTKRVKCLGFCGKCLKLICNQNWGLLNRSPSLPRDKISEVKCDIMFSGLS